MHDDDQQLPQSYDKLVLRMKKLEDQHSVQGKLQTKCQNPITCDAHNLNLPVMIMSNYRASCQTKGHRLPWSGIVRRAHLRHQWAGLCKAKA